MQADDTSLFGGLEHVFAQVEKCLFFIRVLPWFYIIIGIHASFYVCSLCASSFVFNIDGKFYVFHPEINVFRGDWR